MDQDSFVVAVHVHPGSRHPGVGGTHGDHLVVRVRPRAVDGAANEEVLVTLARVLQVRRDEVGFVRTTRSRDKLVVVRDSPGVRERLRSLRDGGEGIGRP